MANELIDPFDNPGVQPAPVAAQAPETGLTDPFDQKGYTPGHAGPELRTAGTFADMLLTQEPEEFGGVESFATLAKVGLTDDFEKQVRTMATDMFPDEPLSTSMRRFAQDGDDIIFVDRVNKVRKITPDLLQSIAKFNEDGEMSLQSPIKLDNLAERVSKNLAFNVSRLPEEAAAGAADVFMMSRGVPLPARLPVTGVVQSAASIPRQVIANFITGNDLTDIPAGEVAQAGVAGVLNAGVTGAQAKLLEKNAAKLLPGDVNRLKTPGELNRVDASIKAFGDQDMPATLGQVTDVPSARVTERRLLRTEEGRNALSAIYDKQGQRIPERYLELVKNIGENNGVALSVADLKNGAVDIIKAAKDSRTAQASPFYEDAMNSGVELDIQDVIALAQDEMANVRGPRTVTKIEVDPTTGDIISGSTQEKGRGTMTYTKLADALNLLTDEKVTVRKLGGLEPTVAREMITAVKTGRGMPQEPKTLAQWLRSKGGLDINDVNVGDLKGMGLKHKEAPTFLNKDGMTLDDAALRAWEDGYFQGDRPDINTFLDALDDDLRGMARYSEQDLDLLVTLDEYANLREEIDRAGLDINTSTIDQIEKAIFGSTSKTPHRTEEDFDVIPRTSYRDLHSAKEEIDAMIEDIKEGGKSTEKRALRALEQVKVALTQKLIGGHPSYAEGHSTFLAHTPRISDLESGMIGQIAKMRDDRPRAELLSFLFSPSQAGDPALIRGARQEFDSAGKLDEWNSALVTYMNRELDKAERTEARQFGNISLAGSLRKALFKTDSQRRILSEAIGDSRITGDFDKFFQVLERIEGTLPENSATATDLGNSNASPVARAAKWMFSLKSVLNPGEMVEAVSDSINTSKLVKIFTTEKGQQELRKLRKLDVGGLTALEVVARIVNMAAMDGLDQGPDKPEQYQPKNMGMMKP